LSTFFLNIPFRPKYQIRSNLIFKNIAIGCSSIHHFIWGVACLIPNYHQLHLVLLQICCRAPHGNGNDVHDDGVVGVDGGNIRGAEAQAEMEAGIMGQNAKGMGKCHSWPNESAGIPQAV
jgi:hypothetical protein